MAYRDDLEAAHARIQALEAELAGAREQGAADVSQRIADLEAAHRETDRSHGKLVQDLAAAQTELVRLRDELARVRSESAGYVERIRVLQDQRAKQVAPPTTNQPARLDRGAPPICPHCRKTGREVRLMRDVELTPAVCPQCTAITLLR